MYKRKQKGWMKHWDFILFDILILQAVYVLSCGLYLERWNPYLDDVYQVLSVVLLASSVIIDLGTRPFEDVLRRGKAKEFKKTLKNAVLVLFFLLVYLFGTKNGEAYSRVVVFLTCGSYLFAAFLERCIYKNLLSKHKKNANHRSMYIFANGKNLPNVIQRIQKNNIDELYLAGAVCLDDVSNVKEIAGVPVVATLANAQEVLLREWVDEVFFYLDTEETFPDQLLKDLSSTGTTIHIRFANPLDHTYQSQFIETMAGYSVVTYAVKSITPMEALGKRMFDILGGLVGCLITLVLVIIIGPMIYAQSPGPIFFAQERIGRNGKKFKMYKFRSMYLDAEERKKELMDENRVKDGFMFKLDYDPRIIGSKKLEDGTIKKGIGNVIRDTSLDEFPQFWNVLKGDMSLIGTRPPTVDEWEKYELHHRSRLAIKPGITGLWQISGRSQITDFEEVVSMDQTYINNWSFSMDLSILAKTVLVVLKRDGAM